MSVDSKNIFKCEICDCSYKQKTILMTHLQKTHLVEKLSCWICKEVAGSELLESHPIRHSVNVIHFDCLDFHKQRSTIVYEMNLEHVFTNQSYQLSLTCYKQISKTTDSYKCSCCDEKLPSRESFFEHISKTHSFSHFSCHKCNFPLKCPDLIKHLHEVHLIELKTLYLFHVSFLAEESDVVVKEEPKESIEEEPVTTVSNLNMFLGYAEDFLKKCSGEGKSRLCLKLCRDPLNQKLFRCEVCDLCFKTPITLKLHLTKIHSTEDVFSCNVCFANLKLPEIVTGQHRHDNETFILTLQGEINEVSTVETKPSTSKKKLKKCEWNYTVQPFAMVSPECEEFLKDRLCVNIKLAPENNNFCKVCNLFNIGDVGGHVKIYHYSQDSYFCQECKSKVDFKDFVSHAEKHFSFLDNFNFISLFKFSEKTICFNSKFIMGGAREVLKYAPLNLRNRFCVTVKRVAYTVDSENSCTICDTKLKSKNVKRHLDFHFADQLFFCKKCKGVLSFDEFLEHMDFNHTDVKLLEYVSNCEVDVEKISEFLFVFLFFSFVVA